MAEPPEGASGTEPHSWPRGHERGGGGGFCGWLAVRSCVRSGQPSAMMGKREYLQCLMVPRSGSMKDEKDGCLKIISETKERSESL